MIFGHIRDLESGFAWLPEPLQFALQHLKQTDFSTLPNGPYELRGRDIHVNVMEVTTKPTAEARPEIHREYLDVQFLLTGAERIGVVADTGSNVVAEDLLAERDLLFYADVNNESWLNLAPGNFALLMPNDVHRPCCAALQPMTIRKVVVKVRVSLLGGQA